MLKANSVHTYACSVCHCLFFPCLSTPSPLASHLPSPHFFLLLPNSLLTPGSLAYLISPPRKGKKWLLRRLYYVGVPYPWVKLTLTRRAVLIAVGLFIVTGCFSIEIVLFGPAVGLPI